jgi:hypothetical protein
LISLLTEELVVDIDPASGAEIVSILDRRSGRALLASAPDDRERTVRGDLSTTDWVAGYRGGWQLLTPNAGESCSLNGITHGFHGRASNEQWDVDSVDGTSARLVWQGHGLRVARQYKANESTLEIHTSWTATSDMAAPMIHVEHFALGSTLLLNDVTVGLPALPGDIAGSTLHFNSKRPAMTFDVLGPFAGGAVEIGVRGGGTELRLKWESDELPYVWLWHENQSVDGVWGETSRVLGIEPASIGNDEGLAFAVERDEATWVGPGEVVSRTVSLEVLS